MWAGLRSTRHSLEARSLVQHGVQRRNGVGMLRLDSAESGACHHRRRRLQAAARAARWGPRTRKPAAPLPHAPVFAGWYKPPSKSIAWQYQLSDTGTITYKAGKKLYLIDLDTARTQIAALRSKDATVQVTTAGPLSAHSIHGFSGQLDLYRSLASRA